MKRIQSVLLFFFITITLSGQRSADYGVLVGVSSYFGDINKNRLLYAPHPAGGILYRYNLHPRQALRASLLYGGFSASDMDFYNSFQKTRSASFKANLAELEVQFEFNFLPYTTAGKPWDYTPYFAAGAGIAYISTNSSLGTDKTSYNSFEPVIPFSFGFKVNIYKNIGLEAEYGFRKTFYDNFDGLKDLVAPSDVVWIHNNDWYTFTGVTVTWKIYNKLVGCPTYYDVDSKRKR